MSRLLAANFTRLRKNKLFYLCLGFMIFLAVTLPISQAHQIAELNQQRGTEYETVLDQQYFIFVMFIGLVASVFCGMFLGTEYSDGTVRNKIVVGHKRTSVYLANLITCASASLMMCIVFIAVYLAVGYPLLGGFHSEIKQILLLSIAGLMTAVSFASIFTLISAISQNKAAIAVSCILFAFVSMFAGQIIEIKLEAPEFYSGYTYTDDKGQVVEQPSEKNPNYLEGTKREIYEFLHDFLPGDQQQQIGTMKAEKPWLLTAYSATLIVMTTGAGLYIFRRKNLK